MNISTNLTTLDVREGDTLVAYVPQALSDKQVSAITAKLAEDFPKAARVSVIPCGIQLMTAREGTDELLIDIRDTLKRVEEIMLQSNGSVL